MEESHEATPAPADQEAVETELQHTPEDSGTSESFTDSPPEASDPLYQRYVDMQGDYTRKTQSLAEQRKELEARIDEAESWRRLQEDPDFQRQALEAMGYQLPDDEPEPAAYGYEPEYEPEQYQQSDPRIDMLVEAEAKREAQAIASEIHDHINKLSEGSGVKLTPRQQAWLFREAVDGNDPQPHRTEAIFNDFVDELRAQRGDWEKDWLASKRGLPQVAKGGQQGSTTLDIRDKDQRVKAFAAAMDAHAQEI